MAGDAGHWGLTMTLIPPEIGAMAGLPAGT